MPLIARYKKNEKGRDLVVGDIHGHFSRLEEKLANIGFDPEKDRLFCVGDLVDRGPESELALEWLAEPWFFSVKGNHEVMAVEYAAGKLDPELYRVNGGSWFITKSEYDQKQFAQILNDLPVAIEVETEAGVIGIVHAECPLPDWAAMINALGDPVDIKRREEVFNCCIWSRERHRNFTQDFVGGISMIFSGHTPVSDPLYLGNHCFIETTGWRRTNGRFSIFNLQTLEEQ